jgi:RNA polymerase sigma-70 factor, ECF subfamily
MALGGEFENVLHAARAGADWALAAIYRDLHPGVLRYLRAQEPGEAEDLASEMWLDVASGLHRFTGSEDGFRRWVFTIARHRLLDLRRQKGRRRTDPVPLEAMAGHIPAGDVEAEAIANLSTEAAIARIATLPPDQAEVLLLRVLSGLATKDVAAIMGKRAGTVRILQHRALARLARDLSREAVTQ